MDSKLKDKAHRWVKKNYGRATECEQCGATERIQWSNKGHTYQMVREDWQQLCVQCHTRYDRNDCFTLSFKPVLESLEKGWAILFGQEEWKLKTSPRNVLYEQMGARQFSVKTTKDKKAWLITKL